MSKWYVIPAYRNSPSAISSPKGAGQRDLSQSLCGIKEMSGVVGWRVFI